jgi:hypothetical protein|tara:strand:- start:369 stop:488 length:120 start_codon:yes stop_codon:yes gene_type:complete
MLEGGGRSFEDIGELEEEKELMKLIGNASIPILIRLEIG